MTGPAPRETLHVATRSAWRGWLSEHHDSAPEVWLVSYRKATGIPSIPYHEAVEEALCFGWIDSTRKGLDRERYAQRFTPRRPGSGYSQTNRERLARLRAAGRVVVPPDVPWAELRPDRYVIPDDILDALRSEPTAWAHWQTFPAAYRRIRAAYVDGARDRGEEFGKRLDNLVRKTIEGRRFGYGIDDFWRDPR